MKNPVLIPQDYNITRSGAHFARPTPYSVTITNPLKEERRRKVDFFTVSGYMYKEWGLLCSPDTLLTVTIIMFQTPSTHSRE